MVTLLLNVALTVPFHNTLSLLAGSSRRVCLCLIKSHRRTDTHTQPRRHHTAHICVLTTKPMTKNLRMEKWQCIQCILVLLRVYSCTGLLNDRQAIYQTFHRKAAKRAKEMNESTDVNTVVCLFIFSPTVTKGEHFLFSCNV